jgi:hypothetical protein
MESIYDVTVGSLNNSRSGVDVTTRNFIGGHTSSPVFTFFGQEVFAQDLRQEGVLVRIIQKRPLADVKVRYLDPKCGFTAVFKAPASVFGYNIPSCKLENLLYTITNAKYFYALDQYQYAEYQRCGFSKADLLQSVIEMNEAELADISLHKQKPVESAKILQFTKVA